MAIDNMPFQFATGAGIKTQLGIHLPPGAQIQAYVHHSGVAPDESYNPKLRVTLNAGLALCRAGKGDVVVVLPGHAENISVADQMTSLVAGTRIVGLGHGTIRPTFTWTAATASFLLDVANVQIVNCTFRMAGALSSTTALTVAAPMTVSAASCGLYGCDINVGVDADQLATIGITTAAGASDLEIIGCKIWGIAGAAVTTAISLIAAIRFRMEACEMIAETSAAAVGVLRFATTASTQVSIRHSSFVNEIATGSAAVTGMAGCTGTFRNCGFGYYGNAGIGAITTPGNLLAFDCSTVNDEGETSAPSTPISTAA